MMKNNSAPFVSCSWKNKGTNNSRENEKKLYGSHGQVYIAELNNLQEARTSLNVIVEELHFDLQKYTNNGKASKFYIQKQKKLITSLFEVCETLRFYRDHPYFIELQIQMNKLLGKDSSLNGFHIALQLISGKENFGSIYIPATL